MCSFLEENLMHRPSGWIKGISITLLVAGAALPGMAAWAADATAKPKVVLVELFTSEGCSSCPPADELLRNINGTHTDAGQLIVGISEHVTYWNSLGWADPFSSSIYTERQNAYATSFGLDGAYTPQMVVNGRQEFVGSDRSSLEKALRKEQDEVAPVEVRILSTSVAGSVLTVSFSVAGDKAFHGADIVAVVADDIDRSSVVRGENSGRVLEHVAVARLIVRVAKLQAVARQTVQIPLPPSIRATQGRHLILLAQVGAAGRVLGADSKPL
jgi:hypothetical protein